MTRPRRIAGCGAGAESSLFSAGFGIVTCCCTESSATFRRGRGGGTVLGGPGFGGGAAFQFADPLFHFFARLESHHKLLWDKNLLARTWVPSFTRGPLFDLKNAKVPQFDAFIFHECVDDRIESLLNDLFGLELRQTNLLRNGLYDFFLRHDEVPYRTIGALPGQ